MKFIWNMIKMILAIVCAIMAIALLIFFGPSLLEEISGGKLGSLLPSMEGELLYIEPINQFPDYPTGCESVSLTMLLRHYGVDVTPDDIIEKLPQGSKPYKEDGELYGADPEEAFVGSPYDKDSFGVFNEPIAEAGACFLDNVHTMKGASITDISRILKTGNPVMVWYTSHPDTGFSYEMRWYTEDGEKLIEWPSGEHAVVIYGEDLFRFYYADPINGTFSNANKLTFRKYFNEIGGRIVYYEY